jgi:hypothetical protein
MEKNVILGVLLTILFFLSISSPSMTQNDLDFEFPTQVGVSVGDEFNYKITDDSLLSDQSPLSQFSMSELLGDFNDFNLTEFQIQTDISVDNLELNTSLVPQEGDIVKVTVVELPSATANGTISITYGNNTKELETFFFFGSPVTTTNWTFWENMLSQIDSINDNITDVTLSSTISKDTQTFNFSLTVYVNNLPDVLTDSGVSNLQFKVFTSYNKTTGVQESAEFTLSGKVETSDFSSNIKYSYAWELTDEEPDTGNSNEDDSSGIESSPGFELISLLLGLTIFAVVYNRRK